MPSTPDFSQGVWYKVGFPTGGIYYVDRAWFQSQGVPWQSVRPSQARLWAGAGRILPQVVSESSGARHLIELSAWSTFSQDQWNRTGRLYFYVGSAQQSGEELHPYSDSTFVYLTFTKDPGRRATPKEALAVASGAPSIQSCVRALEKEEHSLVRSGRHWVGDYFSAGLPARTLVLSTPGRLPDSDVVLEGRAVSTVTVESTLKTGRSSLVLPRIGTGRYDRKGQWVSWREVYPAATWMERQTLTFSPGTEARGGFYLDRLVWRYKRTLDFDADPFIWGGMGVLEATLPGWAWSMETGDLHQVPAGRRQLPTGEQSWILWRENQARQAGACRRVELAVPSPRGEAAMVLITAPAFRHHAQRYAHWKEQTQDLVTDVWTTEQIYARYSAGMPDPTALRNLLLSYHRMPGSSLEHVLLMGDGSYDMKNHLRFPTFHPDYIVPTYVSRESLEPIYSFNSDDYFGFMEDGEGEWPEGERRGGFWMNDPLGNHTMDLSVGRLPVRDVEQAREVVDKLIRYQTAEEPGRGLVFAADDGDDLLHQQDAEALSQIVHAQRPDIPQQKVYLGAFSERVAGRIPQATEAFFRILEDRPVWVNYTGHGSELVLAEERLFETSLISTWRNVPTPPVWITATCEFGRFDNPALVSAGESLVLAPNGGAIALLTTTRPVFSNTNFILNYAVYQIILEGEAQTLGEIFRRTKNISIAGVLNRNFTLLGDPSLRLPWPKPRIQVKTRDAQGLIFEGFVGDSLGNGTIVAEVFLPEQFPQIQEPSGRRMRYRTEVKGPMFTFPVREGRFSGQIPDTFPGGVGAIRWRWEDRSGYSIWEKATSVTDTAPPSLEVTTETSGAVTIWASDPSGIYQGIWPDERAAQFSWDGQHWQSLGAWAPVGAGKYRQTVGAPPTRTGEISLRISDTYTNQASGTFIWGQLKTDEPNWGVRMYPNPVTAGPLNVSVSLGESHIDRDIMIEFFDPMGALLYVRTESCYICTSEWKILLPEPLPTHGLVLYRVTLTNRWNQQTYHTQGRLYFAR